MVKLSTSNQQLNPLPRQITFYHYPLSLIFIKRFYHYQLNPFPMKKALVFLFLFLFSFSAIKAQIAGCRDPAANNYNSSVTVNDGSCTYNDSGCKHSIYALNTTASDIQRTVTITNATNIDWEDIAQDNKFIYIGDFGNNANGNRTDLKIYKIAKADVLAGNTVTAGVINFSYNDQTDFTSKGNNNTNFDCEAMIAFGDSLYLFSKDWVDNKTRVYKLPKRSGTFSAIKIAELNVQGLITGADILADQRVIVLSGYSPTLSPFIYLLYDFTGNHFFGANKRKVLLNQSFTQVEGICAKTTTTFFISNERFSKLGIIIPAKLQQLNLSSLLNPYYSALSTAGTFTSITNTRENNEWASVINGSNWLRVKILSAQKNTAIEIYDAKVYSGNKRLTRKFMKE